MFHEPLCLIMLFSYRIFQHVRPYLIDIDICSIIDSVVPKGDRETGPSIGEYFLYCIWNRMVESVSKNKLAEWY